MQKCSDLYHLLTYHVSLWIRPSNYHIMMFIVLGKFALRKVNANWYRSVTQRNPKHVSNISNSKCLSQLTLGSPFESGVETITRQVNIIDDFWIEYHKYHELYARSIKYSQKWFILILVISIGNRELLKHVMTANEYRVIQFYTDEDC